MSVSMHIQNLDKFYKRVLKILCGNKKNYDKRTNERRNKRTNGWNDRQPKSYLAPPFSKGAINIHLGRISLDISSEIMFLSSAHTLS